MKSSILGGRVLRARTPAGIDQEVYALLVSYQVLRLAMTDATDTQPGTDPDRASFTIALHAARDQLVQAAGVIAETPSTWSARSAGWYWTISCPSGAYVSTPARETSDLQIQRQRQHQPNQLQGHHQHRHPHPAAPLTTGTNPNYTALGLAPRSGYSVRAKLATARPRGQGRGGHDRHLERYRHLPAPPGDAGVEGGPGGRARSRWPNTRGASAGRHR